MLSDRLNDLSLLNSAAEADWHNALYMEHSLSPVSSRLLGDDHCSLMLPATRGYVPKGGGLTRAEVLTTIGLVAPNRLQQVHRIALMLQGLNALTVLAADATPTQ